MATAAPRSRPTAVNSETQAAINATIESFKQSMMPTIDGINKRMDSMSGKGNPAGMSAERFLLQGGTKDWTPWVGPRGPDVFMHGDLRKPGRFKMVGYREERDSETGHVTKSGKFGDFLKAVADHCDGARAKTPPSEVAKAQEYLQSLDVGKFDRQSNGEIVKTALAESSGVVGGYTVPQMFMDELLAYAVENSVVRQHARRIPMTSRTLLVPCLDQVTTNGAGVSNFLGGVQAAWEAEAVLLSEYEPLFRQMELTAWTLGLISIASMQLLQDNAVAMDALLTELFSMAIDWFSDYAFLQGNGAGKPLGIINSPAFLTVTRDQASQFSLKDASGMFASMYAGLYKNSLCWAMHQTVYPYLIRLNDESGSTANTGRLAWLPFDQGATRPLEHPSGPWSAGLLFGFPVYITEKLPALGSTGDVLFFDPASYLIGDRMDLEIDATPVYKFANYQMTWRVIARMDGRAWQQGAITLADGVKTVSGLVGLHS